MSIKLLLMPCGPNAEARGAGLAPKPSRACARRTRTQHRSPFDLYNYLRLPEPRFFGLPRTEETNIPSSGCCKDLFVMTTPGEELPSSGSVSSGAVRSSVSGASDSAHKHVSPHIGQIDSCKYRRTDVNREVAQ